MCHSYGLHPLVTLIVVFSGWSFLMRLQVAGHSRYKVCSSWSLFVHGPTMLQQRLVTLYAWPAAAGHSLCMVRPCYGNSWSLLMHGLSGWSHLMCGLQQLVTLHPWSAAAGHS
jgi:hypothetical protein